MKRLREFLEKGLRVDVTLLSKKSRKKGKREATLDEAKEVLKAVRRTALEEVVGTKEWKPADGQVLKSYKIFLEGPQGRVKKVKEEGGTKDGGEGVAAAAAAGEV